MRCLEDSPPSSVASGLISCSHYEYGLCVEAPVPAHELNPATESEFGHLLQAALLIGRWLAQPWGERVILEKCGYHHQDGPLATSDRVSETSTEEKRRIPLRRDLQSQGKPFRA